MKNEGIGQATSERQTATETGGIACDKTRWMRCLWEDGRAVTVVSRPSGFGKTHFLTRLRAFFEMDYARPIEPAAAARELFAETEIRQDASFCDANLGRWPVVFLSLEAVQGESFDDLVQSFASIVAQQAKAHEWLLASPRLPDDLKSDFADLLRLPELPCEQRKAALRNALRDWTDALAESCGRSVVVLVDDYDAPLVQARRCGALAEMSFLMRSFFGRALKDARSVRKAVLMGRFAPEPSDECHQFAFRGLADPWLAGAFGFTAVEQDELLAKAGLLARKDEAAASCGGWRFGGEEVSRPEDWLRFCQNQAAREPALDPAAAREVCDFLEAADEAQLEDFKRLLAGAMIEAPAADALAVSPVACGRGDGGGGRQRGTSVLPVPERRRCEHPAPGGAGLADDRQREGALGGRRMGGPGCARPLSA